MKLFVITLCLLISSLVFSNSDYRIVTSDIANFWHAFDLLESARTGSDSINIIQKQYLDKASPEFIEFIIIRKFTAAEYVKKIGLYPLFWNSVRPLTEDLDESINDLEDTFARLKAAIPNYNQPNLCFAIGCLRTGGAISGNLILIGSEIAAADHTVEKSELSPWLQSKIGNTGGLVSMVAHETIHTQQFDHRKMIVKKNALLEQTMTEGIADFLSFEILGLNTNAAIHEYGRINACDLLKAFDADVKSEPGNYSNWLYNGGGSNDRPADLGYYIGFKIAESYFQNQSDKRQAIRQLLNKKRYKKMYRESQYFENNCG